MPWLPLVGSMMVVLRVRSLRVARLGDHVVRRARLDRTADVECSNFTRICAQFSSGMCRRRMRGVAHRLEHVVVNHDFLLHHAAAQACHANISGNYTRTPSGCREAPLPFPNRFFLAMTTILIALVSQVRMATVIPYRVTALGRARRKARDGRKTR